MKCTQGRRTLYAPHGLAWVTYRLSVTPIGGCVDPLARRSSRLDGQEYCQVTTREAECCIMCSQGSPDVSRPRSGGGRRVAGRLRGAWPGKQRGIRASDVPFECKGAKDINRHWRNLTHKFPHTGTNQHEEDERGSPLWCRAPTSSKSQQCNEKLTDLKSMHL